MWPETPLGHQSFPSGQGRERGHRALAYFPSWLSLHCSPGGQGACDLLQRATLVHAPVSPACRFRLPSCGLENQSLWPLWGAGLVAMDTFYL